MNWKNDLEIQNQLSEIEDEDREFVEHAMGIGPDFEDLPGSSIIGLTDDDFARELGLDPVQIRIDQGR